MANTANSSTLTTDFNVSPYYDDYNRSKRYYRNLFKPGYAVQARELTQSQTFLQKQLASFGQHIFQEGSIVIPGQFNLFVEGYGGSGNGPVKYVKVKDYDNSNNAVTISNFLSKTVTGQTTGIKAEISFTLDGTEASGNTKTIYVDYLSASNTNSSLQLFQPNEVLTSNSGNLVVLGTSPTGTGSAFRISDGVFFAKEHFITFDAQGIILDRYNPVPTCKVGFQVVESIIKATNDASLLDPALESSNYSAPGADRLQLTPTLQVVDYSSNTGAPDFVTLFTIKDGIVITDNERSQYNVLQDEMAKRTFDESGDYYVDGLNLTIREHLSDGENNGVLPSANGGNSQLLFVEVSAGLAYVQGYERQTTVQYVPINKSTTYSTINSQLASASIGSSIQVKEFTGSWGHDEGLVVDLYDTAQTRLTSNKWSTGTQTGNRIGTATLVTLDHNTGTMATPSATYDVYLSDITMIGSNLFSSVRSIYKDNATTADIGADIVLNTASNTAILQDTADTPLLYAVGSSFVKTLKPGNSSDTTFTYKKTSSVSNVSSGIFNVALPTGADDFPYGTSTLTSAQKREILVSVGADANVTLSGTVSNTGTTITGSGTNFDYLNVGDKIAITGVSGLYYISSIASATSLVITTPLASTASGASYVKRYKTGDLLDLTNKGATAGATRVVTSTSATQLSFDLKETLSGTVPATVTYRVSSTGSGQVNKTLRADRFVKINVATSSSTSGPFNLGIPDVYQIKEIRKLSSAFTANTEGTDVTSSFIFDNGQRDLLYDHATITPRTALASTDNLLVRLDYFEPDFTVGQGFFSIDSYPIDDSIVSQTTIKTAEIPIYKSPTTGTNYDLRNHIDFRPIKSKTASDSTTVAGASINPATTTTYNFDANGMRIPAAYSQISFDYEYYLARRDLITMNKDKQISVIYGVPDETPITPTAPSADKVMVLGSMYVSPYPSLSPFYANIIDRRDLSSTAKKMASQRLTQRDLNVLKERVVNLEYYAALTLLEKAAIDLKILDSAGLDRFKNGIFVDSFSNHTLGATYNTDYHIVVDPEEKSIRPVYTIQSIGYDYLSGTNVTKASDLVFMNYTQVEYLNLRAVTTNRNTERTTYRFIGNLQLTPSIDVWADTQTAPDNVVKLPGTFTGVDSGAVSLDETRYGLTTTWNAWQRHVTGYKVFREDGTLLGSFSNEDAAESAARALPPGNVTIETLYQDRRTGTQNYNVTDSNTVSLGDSVINVGLLPYIRPQEIFIKAQGLKPFAKHYVFFDKLNMAEYVTPLSEDEYRLLNGLEVYPSGTILDSGVTSTGTPFIRTATSEAGPLVADSSGVVHFKLRLPAGTEKRFTFGTKDILVTDNISASVEDQTSFAKGYFVAQGITQTKQETTLTTRIVYPRSRTLTQTQAGSTTRTITIPQPEPPFDPEAHNGSCLAYAFKAESEAGSEGLFVTSVDVFCSEKHPTLGVWFEIFETNSAGQIVPNYLPFSRVWLTNAEVPISTNGISNPLTVTFEAPVFLQKGKYYAFVIHPEAGNANYYFWTSRIGETDINTGLPVSSRLNTGRLFTTNNGLIWDVVPDVDLTMKIRRASFDIASTGVLTIGNKAKEKLYLRSLSSSISNYGTALAKGDSITLSGITGGTVNVSDRIIGSNSGANGSVISVGSTYNVNTIGFRSGEAVTVRFSNGTSKGVTANISALAARSAGRIEKSTENATDAIVILNDSTSGFTANSTVVTPGGITATVDRVDNFRYSVVDFEPSYLQFQATTVNFAMKSYSNVGAAGSFTAISPNDNYSYTDERALYSRTNEDTQLSNTRSNQVQVTMRTTSTFVSPVIDLGKTQTLLIDNLINSNVVNETAASGGRLYNKYISKTITLAAGQDAEDIKVVLTSYRPPTTDVKVWVRLLHAEDGTNFAQRPWIELEKQDDSDGLYSSQSNKNDFVEYTYGFPASSMTGSIGQVQYINTANTATFSGYKTYAVKIGLISDNSAIIPRVADLRVLNIQI